jgi:hypothetical protein
VNKENLNEFLRKVLYGLMGIFAPLTVNYIKHLNERMESMSIQLARVQQVLEINAPIADKVNDNASFFLKLESTVIANERRLDRLESKYRE